MCTSIVPQSRVNVAHRCSNMGLETVSASLAQALYRLRGISPLSGSPTIRRTSHLPHRCSPPSSRLSAEFSLLNGRFESDRLFNISCTRTRPPKARFPLRADSVEKVESNTTANILLRSARGELWQ